ncbi:MAG: glycogen synthase GlgA [Deltaproteobacteria bacterium]
MKIVFCASEAVPFAKTGGLADVCGALPQALAQLDNEVIVVLPRYRTATSGDIVVTALNEDFDVGRIDERVWIYLLKDPSYLRSGLYGDQFGDYPDNLKRFTKLCAKTYELICGMKEAPDIVHCHDWQAALLPVYLKDRAREKPASWSRVPRTLLTLHNIAYQGIFHKSQMPLTGLGWDYFGMSGVEFYGKINLLKGGIIFADHVNTVSPAYAAEVLTPEGGCGLEGVLAGRKEHFTGILNGIDYRVWNPQGDTFIAKNYSFQDVAPKKDNKRVLQEACALKVGARTPLVGFVGRLVEQKGVELILEALPRLCAKGVQLVILGHGDVRFEDAMIDAAARFPGSVFYSSSFDDHLAHQIYAGSDIFLMPSRFEPCGIGQLISFKYGTVPVVYRTGGLADTVTDRDEDPERGSGFVFRRFTSGDLEDAVARALRLFENEAKWMDLVRDVMRLNFSWKEAARRYLDIYRQLYALQDAAS